MRKFLTVLALSIVTIGLIIGGIILFVQFGDLNGSYKVNSSTGSGNTITDYGMLLGLAIALFVGGIGSGVATIANIFTARTKDK